MDLGFGFLHMRGEGIIMERKRKAEKKDKKQKECASDTCFWSDLLILQ